MNVVKNSRKLHKWLMLFIGIQFVIWSVTGAYMVFFDIDYIHGDSLVVNHQEKISVDKVQFSLSSLYQQYPHAEQIEVGKFIDKEVYRFVIYDNKTKAKTFYLLDATTGTLLSPLDEQSAIKAAKYHYSGAGNIKDLELITNNPPFELSARALPAWRVNFDDFGAPSIYISVESGKLVGKRHEFWRLFDWMFRFHVMDYNDGEDIDNLFLFIVVLFGILAAITGLILMYVRVIKPNGKRIFVTKVKRNKLRVEGVK